MLIAGTVVLADSCNGRSSASGNTRRLKPYFSPAHGGRRLTFPIVVYKDVLHSAAGAWLSRVLTLFFCSRELSSQTLKMKEESAVYKRLMKMYWQVKYLVPERPICSVSAFCFVLLANIHADRQSACQAGMTAPTSHLGSSAGASGDEWHSALRSCREFRLGLIIECGRILSLG